MNTQVELQHTTVDQTAETLTYSPPHGIVLHNFGVILVTSATVGNRFPVVELRNAADVVRRRYSPFLSAGLIAGITYFIMSGRSAQTGAENSSANVRMIAFPQFLPIPAGWDVHIRDFAAISAADRFRGSFTISGLSP